MSDQVEALGIVALACMAAGMAIAVVVLWYTAWKLAEGIRRSFPGRLTE